MQIQINMERDFYFVPVPRCTYGGSRQGNRADKVAQIQLNIHMPQCRY